MTNRTHQYIERSSGKVKDELFLYDRQVRWMYSHLRESAPWVFKWLSHSSTLNSWLARINFDQPMKGTASQIDRLVKNSNIRADEIYGALLLIPTWRAFFCRKIRFWEVRPLPADAARIVAPCPEMYHRCRRSN
jgi:phosphatidylserine decarboxylase